VCLNANMATLFDSQTRPSIRNLLAGRHRPHPRSPFLSSSEAWSSTWRYSPTRTGWIPASNGQTRYHRLLLRSPRLSPTLFPRPPHLTIRADVQQLPLCVRLVPLLTSPYRVCRRLQPQPIKNLVNLDPKLNLLHIRPRSTLSSSFGRPTASPNLSAVAVFSQARQATFQNQSPSMNSSLDDLSDPPPQSYLHSSSRSSDRASESQAYQSHSIRNRDRGSSLLAPPSDHSHRSEHRPSSRRALTRALELAREAVQLDSTNEDPEAAVHAYAQSVALLSAVMERVRSGEDTTDSHRRRRRRSVAAQEEEIRRLQNIVSHISWTFLFVSDLDSSMTPTQIG
jgi:hypothetical protein